jgi:hypothetical protein
MINKITLILLLFVCGKVNAQVQHNASQNRSFIRHTPEGVEHEYCLFDIAL